MLHLSWTAFPGGYFRRESRQSKNRYIRRLQNRPRSTRAHVCTRAGARACVRGHERPGASRLRCVRGDVRRTGHKIPHAFCLLRSRGVENMRILVSQPRHLTIPWPYPRFTNGEIMSPVWCSFPAKISLFGADLAAFSRQNCKNRHDPEYSSAISCCSLPL